MSTCYVHFLERKVETVSRNQWDGTEEEKSSSTSTSDTSASSSSASFNQRVLYMLEQTSRNLSSLNLQLRSLASSATTKTTESVKYLVHELPKYDLDPEEARAVIYAYREFDDSLVIVATCDRVSEARGFVRKLNAL